MPETFPDRAAAGRLLAKQLTDYADRDDVLVLALPRGGVPVAREVADALNAPLDLLLIRKLGVPGHAELAMGAIASGGTRVLNQQIVESLGISPEMIDRVAAAETAELERRAQTFRGERPAPNLEGKVVILVDDGLATGASMRAAIDAARDQAAGRIVAAVPVAPPPVCHELRDSVDEMICLNQPEPFQAVGIWYQHFDQVTDGEVRKILGTV